MRLVFNIILIAGLAVIALTLASWVWFVHTPPGRDFLKTQVETRAQQVVREQLSSELTIGELGNGLPGRVVLDDVTLSADGEVWFRAGRIEMDWEPFALIGKKLVVRSFLLEDAALLAMPPERPGEEEESDEPFSLPQELPWVEVDRLRINPLYLADGIAGPARTIRAEGRVSTADNRLASNLQVTTGDNDDLIRAIVGTRNQILTVDLEVDAQENGLVNHYLDAGGPVRLTLEGMGPLSEWSGSLAGDAARWGSADLDFSGNLAARDRLSLSGTVRPGENWPQDAASALGKEAIVDIALVERPGGRVLTVDHLEGRFGMLAGQLGGIGEDLTTVDNGEVDLTLSLAAPYAAELSAGPLAGENRLTGTLTYDEDGAIRADSTLVTPAGRADFQDLSWNGERFAAWLVVMLSEPPLDSETLVKLFPRGGEVRGDIVYEDGLVTADDLVLFSGASREQASLSLTGNGRYAIEAGRFRADGSLRATPAVIARFTDQVGFSGPVSARFTAAGTPDDLDLRLDTNYAAGRAADYAFAAGRLNADFTGLPGAPQGSLALSAADDSYSARVQLAADGAGVITARELFLRAPAGVVTGDVRLNPETLAADAQLILEASEGATLPDGSGVSGSAELDLSVTPPGTDDTRRIEAVVTARDLVFADMAVESLTARISGTDRDADITVEASDAILPNEYLVSTFTTEATITRQEETITARIASLVAQTGSGTPGETIRLLSPATATWSDGTLIVEETRIDGFDRSEAVVSGQYGPQRWVVRARGSAFRIPTLQAPLDFTVDLDTDREVPGTITLSGEVRDENDDLHRMVLNGEWDGQSLSARAVLRQMGAGGQDSEPGEIVFSMPLVLTRAERLGVETGDGAIEGRVSYDAGIETLVAFLPLNEDYLSGGLNARIDIGGTLAAPDISGEARLSNGRFEENRSGAVLTNMAGTIDFSYGGSGSEGRFRLEGADANGRPGSFTLTGSVLFGDAAGDARSAIDGQLTLNRATIIQSSDLTVRTSADLALSGSLHEMLLEGNVDILNFDAVIPDLPSRKSYTPVTVVRVDADDEEEAEPDPAAPAQTVTINLDLNVTTDNEIYIVGRGLQSEWQTDLSVTGTTAQPIVQGNISTIDGSFDFAGREFEITESDIVFTGSREINPRLEISAQYTASTAENSDVTAIISVTGTAQDPKIELTSNPALPQEDVMSLVLFGKNPSQLSAYESLQIARSVATLTATGPFGGAGIVNSLRRSAGLDTLSFGEDSDTGDNTLTVGKYVSDEVYVSATQGLGDAGSSVSVTYEVSDHVTVETTVEQNGAQSVSANYKKDY